MLSNHEMNSEEILLNIFMQKVKEIHNKKGHDLSLSVNCTWVLSRKNQE